MMKCSTWEHLMSEFVESLLNIDVTLNYKNVDFYKPTILEIANYLKIGKITLTYESSQIHTNLLIHKEPLYSKGINVLYDSSEHCNNSEKVSFYYSQNDGNYTLTFFPLCNQEPWNEEIASKLKKISSISFNILSRIKLSEIARTNEYYDYSTGILNTNGIITSMMKLSMSGNINDYFCCHLNVRHFKKFNIQYSYAGGDKILRIFSHNMYDYLGENQFFGRLGGDNFSAIVLKSNKQNFLDYISNINVPYENDIIHIDLYVGVYDIYKDDDIATILNNSSTAFNISKNTPTCHYVEFTEEMHRQALEVKQIEDIMRSALANGEFITYYQPKICLTNFQLVGAEALVRWKRNDTLIAPYKFVPIFEKNGFIIEIDFCMLKNVCKSIKNWLSNNISPVTISVNFSKLHLSNPNFVLEIKNIINQYNIPPKYIEIEFTETLDVENYNSLVQVNRELKKYGFKTSIDDFGAGFSSLNMLKDVPVDVVKLDKSLIDDTVSSTREKIIIQDIIKMAKTLDIEVIAEGVEDLDQLLFLKNIKCNQIQGYIFDKPLPLESFQDRLINKEYYKNNPKFKHFIHDKYNPYNMTKMNFGKYTLNLNDYSLLEFNQGFCNIVGYTKDEILKNNFTIENFLLCEEFQDYLTKVVTTLKSHGEICEEHKMIKKNGTKIYVMCLGVLKTNDIAEFMISDISINKVAERENDVLKSHFDFAQRELKNKNYMFEQIVKNLSGGIGIFEVRDDNQVRTIFVSNSFYNVINCKRSDFDKYKNNVLKFLSPKEISLALDDIHKCIESKETILKRYNFNNPSTKKNKLLTLRIKSMNKSSDGFPIIHVVIADYNTNDIEMELINEIAKVSLLTECSNFDMIEDTENRFEI